MFKQKTFIPVAGAILIFIASQIIIVTQVWRQREEVFNLKYRLVAREAVQEMMYKSGQSGFDRAYYIIDNLAPVYLLNIENASGNEDSVRISQDLISVVREVLLTDQEIVPSIKERFKRLGFKEDFDSEVVIKNLVLLTDEGIPQADALNPEENITASSDRHIFLNTFYGEGNFYRISFDYYIDIASKESQLLKGIMMTLLLSLFSLLALTVIFAATYRSYLNQKRLSDLKTDFINNMTHELKTPLSTISVAGKSLLMDAVISDREKIESTAMLIGKQTVHLNNLINLILDITIWEREQFRIKQKRCNLESLLREVADGFRNGCGTDCTFHESYDLRGAEGNLDPVYFHTMVSNLLQNAYKYSTENPTIELRATAEGDSVLIAVKDNGIGISREDQKYIFDKFYRVGTGDLHTTKGLGLGLYYVSRIAEAHGGNIIVSSKKGKGSVFTLEIPKI
ncbi:MAG: HAMP domain-containing histidine kinase [Bacteroidales bacterium]|nr:HAMP domain-containing histidine kinase [Bacteroidales bacterium]